MANPSSGAAPVVGERTRRSLQQWLSWQRQLHPNAVDLGLSRVHAVLEAMALGAPTYPIITIAGTNGKGSTVAVLEAILSAGGYRVGAYTSPHLLRYNERIRIERVAVSDRRLCEAFAVVDAARLASGQSLSAFEFGTLATFYLFAQASLDVGLLEVGLGGRLDAVNAVDADVAIITSIGLDHTEWLGDDRESIGFEKAGIFRRNKPVVCADRQPPQSLFTKARDLAAPLFRSGVDYDYDTDDQAPQQWRWWSRERRFDELARPALIGAHQLDNAAAAIMAAQLLADRLPLGAEAISSGCAAVRNPGRLERVVAPYGSRATWYLDVCHNPDGAHALAQWLRENPITGRTFAIIGMLRDKDSIGVARELDAMIDRWYTVPLSGDRGLSSAKLAQRLRQAAVPDPSIEVSPSVSAACRSVVNATLPDDRVIVCGSIYAVARILRTQLLGGQ